jgi:hypothetical protein
MNINKINTDMMRRLFRFAIPEISDEATLFFIHSNPYKDPEGKLVDLSTYKIPGPGSSVFEFTIAHKKLFGQEVVFVLSIPERRIPQKSRGQTFYILQYLESET